MPGVGEVEAFGSQYAMRIWLEPDKLTDFRMTLDDVRAASAAPASPLSQTLAQRGTPTLWGKP